MTEFGQKLRTEIQPENVDVIIPCGNVEMQLEPLLDVLAADRKRGNKDVLFDINTGHAN